MATTQRFNLAKWGLDRWQVVGIVLGTLGVADTVYLMHTKLMGARLYCGEQGGRIWHLGWRWWGYCFRVI